ELVDALEAILAGRRVAVTETIAPGCPLSPAQRSPEAGEVTYCRDIAPILQRRCQVCHRRGQSAPFSLMTYHDAATWADAMREVIDEGRMPPWGASPKHGRFANDPSLSPAEKAILFRWIDSGRHEGDRAQLPTPATFPESWSIPGP